MITFKLIKIGLPIVFFFGTCVPAIAQLKGVFRKNKYELSYSKIDEWLYAKLDSLDIYLENVKSDSTLTLDVSGFLSFGIQNWKTSSINLKSTLETSGKNDFVSIKNSTFSRSLFVTTDKGHVQVINATIDRLLLIECNRTNIVLVGVDTHELDITTSYLGEEEITCYVRFNDVTIHTDSRIEGPVDSVNFNGFTAKDGVLRIDSYRQPLLIFTKPMNLKNLDFDFSKVYVRLDHSKENEEDFWENLKQMQEMNNYSEGYKLADIKLQTVRLEKGSWIEWRIVLPLRVWWNNFGYNKSRIVSNTAWLFLIFFTINLILYMPLTEKVYPLEGLNDYLAVVRKSYGRNFLWGLLTAIPYALYFSIVVFFGLRLDFKTLNLHYKVGCFYVFVQYLIGVICLAYLANLVLTR